MCLLFQCLWVFEDIGSSLCRLTEAEEEMRLSNLSSRLENLSSRVNRVKMLNPPEMVLRNLRSFISPSGKLIRRVVTWRPWRSKQKWIHKWNKQSIGEENSILHCQTSMESNLYFSENERNENEKKKFLYLTHKFKTDNTFVIFFKFQ